jgi:hypothetical protein
MTPESAKAVAETIALACAAIFFVYKLISGYLYVEMCLSISSTGIGLNRKPLSNNPVLA